MLLVSSPGLSEWHQTKTKVWDVVVELPFAEKSSPWCLILKSHLCLCCLGRHWGQTVSIHPGSWEPKVCQVSAEDSHSGMKGTAQWVPYINLYMSQWAPKGGHPTHNYTSQLWVCAPEFALKCKEAWKTESNMCKAWTGACVCKISL